MAAPRAVMVVSGTRDILFPPLGQREAARQIAEAYAWAGCAGRFRDYAPDKEHCYDAEIQSEALAWFDTHLKKQQTAASGKSERQSLFNGRDLSGWHIDVPEMDTNALAKTPFIIRHGMLVSLGNPQGHIITDSVYQNYRLQVEYRFAGAPGNCGVILHASTPRVLYKMFPKSIEAQMVHGHAGDFWCIGEDISVPEMESRRGPKAQWGTTEGKGRRILNLTDNSEKPAGEWNTMVVECLGHSIKVWVNDDLVNHGSNCTANKGQIALQAEGSEVEFRKVELTPITKLTDK